MSSSKQFDLERDFAAGVYRLEIKSVMLVFSTQLCQLLPLSPFLWFNSLLPPSMCEYVHRLYVQYTLYTYSMYKGGGMGFWAAGR
jgi:hypothetical protein